MNIDSSDPAKPEWSLIEAYLATTYRVDIPGADPLAIRIGQPSPALDRLLDAAGCTSWAYVTACNPGSGELPETDNRHRQASLIERVTARGWKYYTGNGVPDAPGWTPEPSLLILGISERDALALGRAFEQTAIVLGVKGRLPELRLCRQARHRGEQKHDRE